MTSPSTKRARRSPADMQSIRAAIMTVLAEDRPMTVRQVFYRLVSAGAIEKTEAEYKQTVGRLLSEMRIDKSIPHGWIVDNTRYMRKPKTHGTLQAALNYSAQVYRRAIWDNQDAYVEVWLEKDALSGVLGSTTSAWDVPLMVTRGYPSLSFLYEAAEAIANQGKPTFLYYFGDHDPSGVDIPRAVKARIREFAPDADLTFERVAVNLDQVEAMNLPTRPTKVTDSRSKGFEGESVEVDAIPPKAIRSMVKDCITRHIDQDAYRRLKRVEAAEKETVRQIAGYDWQDVTDGHLGDVEQG